MLVYFGILYPNNCGSLRRLHHSALLLTLLLYLPCPRISFTLNSKRFSLNNPFLSCLHQLLSVLWPFDLANGFHLTVIFTLSFIFTSFIYPVPVNKPPSVIAAWQALFRYSKSPHWFTHNGLWGNYYLLLFTRDTGMGDRSVVKHAHDADPFLYSLLA